MSGAGDGTGIQPQPLPAATHIELLREEYFKLQEIVETFDERALQIKGWSVTVSLAGMAAALVADIPADDKAKAFLLAGIAALSFWLIEFFWKCFQWTFLHRIDEIEAAFLGDRALSLAPLQIRRLFHANFKPDLRKNRHKAFKPSVMLPHALIALLGFALAVTATP